MAPNPPTGGQHAVAEHGDGPLLVLGPAGSGRSEALARRLEALVSRGEAPERVLVLARSRAARSLLRERSEVLLDCSGMLGRRLGARQHVEVVRRVRQVVTRGDRFLTSAHTMQRAQQRRRHRAQEQRIRSAVSGIDVDVRLHAAIRGGERERGAQALERFAGSSDRGQHPADAIGNGPQRRDLGNECVAFGRSARQ